MTGVEKMSIITSQYCRICKEVTGHANGVCDYCFEEDRVTVRSYNADGFNNPRHPLWSFLTLAMINIPLLIYFSWTTQVWDTEPWIMAGVFGGSSGVEMLKYFKSQPTSRAPEKWGG